jgi:hypothetical protein
MAVTGVFARRKFDKTLRRWLLLDFMTKWFAAALTQ